MNRDACRACVLVAVAGLAGSALGGVIDAILVVKQGDAIAGSTVATLNTPFTNGLGQVGSVVALADARRAIWYDTGVIFTSDQGLPDTLVGGESTMGIGDNGEFIYSPSFNGGDAVWGENGLIAVSDTQAAGFPSGVNWTFHSRPRMADDGTAYWIAGINTSGGTSSQFRTLYKRDPGSGVISPVVTAGDVLAGLTVATSSSNINFNYSISGNNAHQMIRFIIAGAPTASDECITVDGVLLAREGSPTGHLDNWQGFTHLEINSNGNSVFAGDTDGPTATDGFIAYNGIIHLREGSTVDGLTLGSAINALSINDLDQVAFVSSTVQETETLFFAADPIDLVSAVKVASVGDELDTDGDGIADWVIMDFNASNVIGPGLDLAEDGRVFVEIDMRPAAGGATIEAIVGFWLPGATQPCNIADLVPPFGVLDLADVQAFIAAFPAQDPAADLAPPFGVWDLADIQAFTAAFNAGCP